MTRSLRSAGPDKADIPGKGGPAVMANFNSPTDIAVDSDGNIYIADTFNHRIRKIDRSKNISTVAGNGNAGFSGDGGQATLATLNNPSGVAVDNNGNIYIADMYNQRIRQVNTSGKIDTIAGNGEMGYAGDGGYATLANFRNPSDIALDMAGNIFVADSENNVIRKIDITRNITTVAGNGSQGYSGDVGGATAAALNYPHGVSIDIFGNLYIADCRNYCVRKVDTAGNISTVAGDGTMGFTGDAGRANMAKLSATFGVAVDNSGNVYVCDSENYRIRKIDRSGYINTVAGNGGRNYSGDGGSAASSAIGMPWGIAASEKGDIYFADNVNHIIRAFGPGIYIDKTPPVIMSLKTNPAVISPAKNKMVKVKVSAKLLDDKDSDPTFRIIGVANSENDQDGVEDWIVTDYRTVQLRAEKGASGADRVYTIRVTASDRSGNTTVGETTVTVTDKKDK